MENARAAANASTPQRGFKYGGADDLNASVDSSLSSLSALRSRRLSSAQSEQSTALSFKSPFSITPTATMRSKVPTPMSQASSAIGSNVDDSEAAELCRTLFKAQHEKTAQYESNLLEMERENKNQAELINSLQKEKRTQSDLIAKLDRDNTALAAELESTKTNAETQNRAHLAALDGQRHLAVLDAQRKHTADLERQLAAALENSNELQSRYQSEVERSNELKDEVERVRAEIARIRAEDRPVTSVAPSLDDSVASIASASSSSSRRMTRSSMGVSTPKHNETQTPSTPQSMTSTSSTMSTFLASPALRRRVEELTASNGVLRRETESLSEHLRDAAVREAAGFDNLAAARSQIDEMRIRETKLRAQRDSTVLALKRSFEADLADRMSAANVEVDSAREEAAKNADLARDLQVRIDMAEANYKTAQLRVTDAKSSLEFVNKSLKSVESKLDKEKSQNEALRSDLTLLHKQHKRDMKRTRAEFKAGAYEQRFNQLLLQQKEVDATLEVCQNLLGGAADIQLLTAKTQSIYQSVPLSLVSTLPRVPQTTAPNPSQTASVQETFSETPSPASKKQAMSTPQSTPRSVIAGEDGGGEWTNASAMFSPSSQHTIGTPVKDATATPGMITPVSQRRVRLSARLSARKVSGLSWVSRISDMNEERRVQELQAQMDRLRNAHARELEKEQDKLDFVNIERETNSQAFEEALAENEAALKDQHASLQKALIDLEEALKEVDEVEAEKQQIVREKQSLNEQLNLAQTEMEKELQRGEEERADLLKMVAVATAEANESKLALENAGVSAEAQEEMEMQRQLIVEMEEELNRWDAEREKLIAENESLTHDAEERDAHAATLNTQVDELWTRVNMSEEKLSATQEELQRVQGVLDERNNGQTDKERVPEAATDTMARLESNAEDAVQVSEETGKKDSILVAFGTAELVAAVEARATAEVEVERLKTEVEKHLADMATLHSERNELLEKSDADVIARAATNSRLVRIESRLRTRERECAQLHEKMSLMLEVNDVPEVDAVVKCVVLKAEVEGLQDRVLAMEQDAVAVAAEFTSVSQSHLGRIKLSDQQLEQAEATLFRLKSQCARQQAALREASMMIECGKAVEDVQAILEEVEMEEAIEEDAVEESLNASMASVEGASDCNASNITIHSSDLDASMVTDLNATYEKDCTFTDLPTEQEVDKDENDLSLLLGQYEA